MDESLRTPLGDATGTIQTVPGGPISIGLPASLSPSICVDSMLCDTIAPGPLPGLAGVALAREGTLDRGGSLPPLRSLLSQRRCHRYPRGKARGPARNGRSRSRSRSLHSDSDCRCRFPPVLTATHRRRRRRGSTAGARGSRRDRARGAPAAPAARTRAAGRSPTSDASFQRFGQQPSGCRVIAVVRSVLVRSLRAACASG